MSWRSTATRYGTVAVAIHWVSAIAVLGLIASGFLASGPLDQMAKAALIRIHAIMGAAILVLTGLRFAWWRLVDRKPSAMHDTSRGQAMAAQLVHASLYLLILVIAVSGVGMLVLSGAFPLLFGGASGTLPDFNLYPPRLAHGLATKLLLALLAAHIGAGLYHQLIKRDRLLARIGFDRSSMENCK